MAKETTSDGTKPLKNAKHERFALLVASGEVSGAEAYRREVSDAGTAETQHVESCKLAASPKVRPRIEHLRSRLAEKAERAFDLSKEKWLARLDTIAKSAEVVEDFSAATGALDKIGKACAYYEPEKIDATLEIVVREL